MGKRTTAIYKHCNENIFYVMVQGKMVSRHMYGLLDSSCEFTKFNAGIFNKNVSIFNAFIKGQPITYK